MRTNNLCFILISLIFLYGISPAQELQNYVPGVILVKFKKDVLSGIKQDISPEDILSNNIKNRLEKASFKKGKKIFRNFTPDDTLSFDSNGKSIKLIDLSGWYVLEMSDTVNVNGFIEKLVQLPGIVSAVPEHILIPYGVFPDDPRFQNGYQWGLYNYSSPGKDIHAPAAWELNKGRNDIVVAVVDGGVDYNHNDLDPGDRSRVIQGKDTGDDDNNPMDNLPSSSGWAGHGTSVAGVIGAITDNNLKVAGVMWNCQIMPVKIASNDGYGIFGWGAGEAFNSDIGEGIEYARTHGAYIINMSFGGQGSGWWEHLIIGNPVREATWNAYQQGIVLAAAMGNDDNSTVYYPAGFDWTIAVGATNQSDNRVTNVGWGSNYGSHINLTAPGISYYSTERYQSEGYFGGTSCATPLVSGVAGLILSESRDRGLNLTNDDVLHLMEKSATKVQGMEGQNFHQEYGYGRVNAEQALKYLNAPYTVTHTTKVSTNKTLTWNSHGHTFYDNAGLATGKYFGTKTYKVTAHINFSPQYKEVPLVWIRERESTGWSGANPNEELPYFKITNVTKTGFDVETFIYYVGQRAGEGCVCDYWPGNPNYAEAVFAYTVIGEPAPPPPLSVYISGPTSLDYNEQGTFTANPSGGKTPYTNYRWWQRKDEGGWVPESFGNNIIDAPPAGYWFEVPGWEGQQTVQVARSYDFSLKCEVTDSENSTATDIHSVIVGGRLEKSQSETEDISLASVPEKFELTDNYPNPFNPSTTIKFGLPENSPVKITIYSITGQKIITLADGSYSKGYHEIKWDGKNQAGNFVSNGIYIYELKAGNQRFIKKMVFAK